MYRVFGLFYVHALIVLYFIFLLSKVLATFLASCLQFGIALTAVLASVSSGIKLKALGLKKCFVCDWLFHSQPGIPFSSLFSILEPALVKNFAFSDWSADGNIPCSRLERR